MLDHRSSLLSVASASCRGSSGDDLGGGSVRLKSFVKKLQSVTALSHGPSSSRGAEKPAVQLTEKERQTVLWQHSKSGASLNTVQALSRFFERLGQSVTEEEISSLLPPTWVAGGAPVPAEFVIDVMTKKKQTFDMFRHDPDDILTLFVSFGGNPDRTGTVDAAEIIETMKLYSVRAQMSPLTKPRLTYHEFSQFMSALKTSLSDDVAVTPNTNDLPAPVRRRQSMWAPKIVVSSGSASSSGNLAMDDLSRAFSSPAAGNNDDPVVTNMETSFAFVDERDSFNDDSAASPLRRFITAAVQMHEKRLKTIDTRRNETRAQMEGLAQRQQVKPIRFNGQLSAPPKKKFSGTKCIPPVMLLREELKMEQLLAEVEDLAQQRLKLMLAPRPSTPAQRSLRRPQSALPSRPSSAASSRQHSATANTPGKQAALDDPTCDLMVRDIARVLERAEASSTHKQRIVQKKKEIEQARAAAVSIRAAEFCLSEADMVLPKGFEGVSMGLKIVDSSELPKAKVPDASTLRGSSSVL